MTPAAVNAAADDDVFRVPKTLVWVIIGVIIFACVITLLILVTKVQMTCARGTDIQAEMLATLRQLVHNKGLHSP